MFSWMISWFISPSATSDNSPMVKSQTSQTHHTFHLPKLEGYGFVVIFSRKDNRRRAKSEIVNVRTRMRGDCVWEQRKQNGINLFIVILAFIAEVTSIKENSMSLNNQSSRPCIQTEREGVCLKSRLNCFAIHIAWFPQNQIHLFRNSNYGYAAFLSNIGR